TNAMVNSAMQQIAYANSSEAPPASVQIDWSFSDGNSGTQGTGGALTATGNVLVNITAINDAPVAANDTFITAEDTAITFDVRTNDSDVDSGSLGVTQINSTAISVGGSVAVTGGSVTLNANGTLTFAPTANWNGTPSFTYTLSDGNLTATATVNGIVTDVNNTPVAIADTAIAIEAGGISNGTAGTNPTGNVLANDTDADLWDTKTVTGVAGGTVGSATGNVGSSVNGNFGSIQIAADGSYTYTVDNSNAAVQALRTSSNTLNDVFTYTMQDSIGLASSTQITVTIQGANDAPSDLSGSLTVAENSSNGTAVGTVTGQDIDSGETLSYSLVNDAGGRFAIHSSTGVVTVANGSMLNREAATSHSITVRVTDSSGSSDEKVMAVTLTDVDEFDVGTVTDTSILSNHVQENAPIGTQVGITASALDADVTNNTISYSLLQDVGGRFAIDSTTGVVTVAGPIDREVVGPVGSITVRANSSDGSFTDQIFSIAILDLDEFDLGLITDADSLSNRVPENAQNGTLVGITVSAADLDATNNTFSYTLIDAGGGRCAMDPTTGVVTVADGSRLDYESQTNHSIVIWATSTDGSESIRSLSIDVLPVNERPIALGEQYSTDFVTPITMKFSELLTNDSDPEGDRLRVEIVSMPLIGTMSVLGEQELVYQPESNFIGNVTILYTVSDGFLVSEIQTLQIVVTRPATTAVAPPADRPAPATTADPQPAKIELPAAKVEVPTAKLEPARAAVETQPTETTAPNAILAAPILPTEKGNPDQTSNEDAEESVVAVIGSARKKADFEANQKSDSENTNSGDDRAINQRNQKESSIQRLSLGSEITSGIHIDSEQTVFNQFIPIEERASLETEKQEFVFKNAAPAVVGTAIGIGVTLHILTTAQVGTALISQSGLFMPLDPLTILEGSSKVKKSNEVEDLLFDVASVKQHGGNREAN
ncbi:MAG: Ig-like domain-containing protein, partial [Planctomycetota bacterium]